MGVQAVSLMDMRLKTMVSLITFKVQINKCLIESFEITMPIKVMVVLKLLMEMDKTVNMQKFIFLQN